MKKTLFILGALALVSLSGLPLSAHDEKSEKDVYPKDNPHLKQILSPDIPIEELKKRGDALLDIHDDLWQYGAEIQERDLLNLYYAVAGNTALKDWACNSQGDILLFVEDNESGCVITTFYVFKKTGKTFKRIGTYRFTSRFLSPDPGKLLIEDDGISVTSSWSDSGANSVSMRHKFYFSSEEESFYIFCEWQDLHTLKGKKE